MDAVSERQASSDQFEELRQKLSAVRNAITVTARMLKSVDSVKREQIINDLVALTTCEEVQTHELARVVASMDLDALRVA